MFERILAPIPLFPSALIALWRVAVPAQAPTKPDDRTVDDAYVYLLGRVLVIRQDHMDRAGKDFAYNTIKYNPLGSVDFVNPNFHVAYREAWIALDDKAPAILGVNPRSRTATTRLKILDRFGRGHHQHQRAHFPFEASSENSR